MACAFILTNPIDIYIYICVQCKYFVFVASATFFRAQILSFKSFFRFVFFPLWFDTVLHEDSLKWLYVHFIYNTLCFRFINTYIVLFYFFLPLTRAQMLVCFSRIFSFITFKLWYCVVSFSLK